MLRRFGFSKNHILVIAVMLVNKVEIKNIRIITVHFSAKSLDLYPYLGIIVEIYMI